MTNKANGITIQPADVKPMESQANTILVASENSDVKLIHVVPVGGNTWSTNQSNSNGGQAIQYML